MAFLPLILVFVLLAALDAAAVLVAIDRIGTAELPPIPAAAGIHLVVAAIAGFAVPLFPGAKDRSGKATLGFFAGAICLLTPVVGCLVAGTLVFGSLRKRKTIPAPNRFMIGNPLDRAAGKSRRPSMAPVREPIASVQGLAHRPAQRMVAPFLRGSKDSRAIGLLRRLRLQDDARVQLYAQAALTAHGESGENAIRRARKELEGVDCFQNRTRLAELLMERLRLVSTPEKEKSTIAKEALDHFSAALELMPDDPACLFGRADCLMLLGRMDDVAECYGRLCSLPDAKEHADRLELVLSTAAGNWRRTGASVRRILREGSTIALPEPVRVFWAAT